MDRKELIKRYLDAETTVTQERELADSFVVNPPADEEEVAVFMMLKKIAPANLDELPDTGNEYDRIIGQSKMRAFRTWGLSFTGVAAAIVAVVLFSGKPESPQPQPHQQYEMTDLFKLVTTISYFDPAEAEGYEFKPVGDGLVMTAHFSGGQSASYILTPLDEGNSFNLISLNQ